MFLFLLVVSNLSEPCQIKKGLFSESGIKVCFGSLDWTTSQVGLVEVIDKTKKKRGVVFVIGLIEQKLAERAGAYQRAQENLKTPVAHVKDFRVLEKHLLLNILEDVPEDEIYMIFLSRVGNCESVGCLVMEWAGEPLVKVALIPFGYSPPKLNTQIDTVT